MKSYRDTMTQKIMKFFKRFVSTDQSAHMLSLSFCMGNYIAFSPYIGFHTIMIFLFSWLFKLNPGVTFAAAYGINNIWTAIPVYTADYLFGYWLVHNILHLNVAAWNPAWMESIGTFCKTYLGFSNPCIWSFLIGGNLLGIISSILLYPLLKYIFTKIINEKKVSFDIPAEPL